MSSNRAREGAMRSWLETYNRYFGVADEEQKKKVLSVFYGSLQTYTIYSWDADEEQKKCIIYGNLWVILLKGAMTFWISLKGVISKKVLETLI